VQSQPLTQDISVREELWWWEVGVLYIQAQLTFSLWQSHQILAPSLERVV
jgi:hypothetical protein